VGLSSLIFTNPAGFWALLGLPLVVAIHFLQPKSTQAVISTLFLLEHLPTRAQSGRVWRRLRSSLALWLQLLAVLLLTWLLVGPRWLRPDSTQTIVIVLDATASMSAFREEAEGALRERIPAWENTAIGTEWVLRETAIERPVLYRGYKYEELFEAMDQWSPDRVGHDFTPVLRVARQLVRGGGAVVLLSDHSVEELPDGVALLAVGRPLENAGFVGGSVVDADEGPQWSVLIQQRGQSAATRVLEIQQVNGTVVRSETLEFLPKSMQTITGSFPIGLDALRFRLKPVSGEAPDAFALDDTLALRIPVPRALSWRVTGDGAGAGFFERFFEQAPSMVKAPGGRRADIEVIFGSIDSTGAFSWAAQSDRQASLMEFCIHNLNTNKGTLSNAPVVPENHPWIEGLAWSGLLSPGPVVSALPSAAQALLWQGSEPLAWVDRSGVVPRLILAWDWNSSNADRLPATAVLLHRIVEACRERKLGPESMNLDTNQRIEIARDDAVWKYSEEGEASQILDTQSLGGLRAPTHPTFFRLWRDELLWMEGATQFSDPREGDFTRASMAFDELEAVLDPMMARSDEDALRSWWLLLLLLVLLVTWFVLAPRRQAGVKRKVVSS
jgi:hypothetical protein